jgi:GNAT superfamily N-acetyltransferase
VSRVRRADPDEIDVVRQLLTAALLEPPPSLADAIAAGQVHVAVAGSDIDNSESATRAVGCLVRLPPMETPDADRVTVCVESLDPSRRPFDPAAWPARTAATHVDSVAVARGRRGDGVGTALVESAVDAAGAAVGAADAVDVAPANAVDAADASTDPPPLTVAFRPAVRPFYESLGFTVVSASGSERLVGWRMGDG